MVSREGEEDFVMKLGFGIKRAFATVTTLAVTALPFAKGSTSQTTNLPTDEATTHSNAPASSGHADTMAFNANAGDTTGSTPDGKKGQDGPIIKEGDAGEARQNSGDRNNITLHIVAPTELEARKTGQILQGLFADTVYTAYPMDVDVFFEVKPDKPTSVGILMAGGTFRKDGHIRFTPYSLVYGIQEVTAKAIDLGVPFKKVPASSLTATP